MLKLRNKQNMNIYELINHSYQKNRKYDSKLYFPSISMMASSLLTSLH